MNASHAIGIKKHIEELKDEKRTARRQEAEANGTRKFGRAESGLEQPAHIEHQNRHWGRQKEHADKSYQGLS
jgi:hypothetical protein